MKFKMTSLALSFLIAGGAAHSFGEKAQPYRSDFVYCHDSSLEVEGPVTAEDWQQIRKHPVRTVHTLGNADPDLFENPTNLKGVREAILMSTADNSKALSSLAKNFPNLEELAVSQPAPLTQADMRNIHQMNQLFFLEICNDVPDCASFAASLPPNLKRLLLENTGVAAASTCRVNLPALTYFSLRKSKMSQKFLEGLNAPNLEEVSLSRVWGEPGTFQSFARFPKLKRVFAYNMPQSAITDLQDLQRVCPSMSVVIGDSTVGKFQ
ncbi:MAG: hypothetical protein K2X27_06955 [Candidatus Obscuribacterales bacterium]|nr:hypothetical protein [Candidatus Obscuribacterales bacterium]